MIAAVRGASDMHHTMAFGKGEENVPLSPHDAKLLKSCSEGSLHGVKQALLGTGLVQGVNQPADIEARDPGIGNTPLIWAAFHGYTEIIEYLLSRGADIEAVSRDGHKTALLLASYSGHAEAVLCLLRNGAQIDAANSRGDTSVAIASYMNHASVVSALVSRRANLMLTTNEHKYNALHLAAYKGHEEVVAYILGSDDEDIPLLVNAVDKSGNSPLMLAATQGNLEVMKVIMNHPSCDPNILDSIGNSALILAANRGHVDVVEFLIIEQGVDIDHVNNNQESALTRAAMKANIKVLESLLLNGAAYDIIDKDGVTALERALLTKMSGPLELLTDYYIMHGRMDEIDVAKKRVAQIKAEEEEKNKNLGNLDPSKFVKVEL
jgi:ankyrin repeat protein